MWLIFVLPSPSTGLRLPRDRTSRSFHNTLFVGLLDYVLGQQMLSKQSSSRLKVRAHLSSLSLSLP